MDNHGKSSAFVREVVIAPDLIVMLALDTQLDDLVRFAPAAGISVDTTFNVGEYYVTTVVTRHLMLRNRTTRVSSVIIGVTFIHKRKTGEAYQRMAAMLLNVRPQLTKAKFLGTDGDKAAARKAANVGAGYYNQNAVESANKRIKKGFNSLRGINRFVKDMEIFAKKDLQEFEYATIKSGLYEIIPAYKHLEADFKELLPTSEFQKRAFKKGIHREPFSIEKADSQPENGDEAPDRLTCFPTAIKYFCIRPCLQVPGASRNR
ncbi:uncharacterized protein LOC129592919 [Paramacrobiotus metropolitanus]|uniref:uncharacterized protein LOC129592919 n=1 Tax=Paramacrobiotus metropolitanus TaxID=2943436 RepID=UPI0024459699|nr:uncharacterized protein LOC129592919 [Paramacrobiotus metropolitanus]